MKAAGPRLPRSRATTTVALFFLLLRRFAGFSPFVALVLAHVLAQVLLKKIPVAILLVRLVGYSMLCQVELHCTLAGAWLWARTSFVPRTKFILTMRAGGVK